MQPPRTTAQRIADTQARLQAAVDCWVSSANTQGGAYLIPLSYVWHDGQIIMATLSNGLTMRNLQRAGRCPD
jgi:nitroimidazol reductase NimA-like FMN-containing flavoprotein (pyridoxamine 5'-phosphate oxidase superfamily)